MKTLTFIVTLCAGIIIGNTIFRYSHYPCRPIAEQLNTIKLPDKPDIQKQGKDSSNLGYELHLIIVNNSTGKVERKIVLQKCSYSQVRDMEKVYREKHQSNEVRTAERQQKKQRGENEVLAAGIPEIWGMKKALALISKK